MTMTAKCQVMQIYPPGSQMPRCVWEESGGGIFMAPNPGRESLWPACGVKCAVPSTINLETMGEQVGSFNPSTLSCIDKTNICTGTTRFKAGRNPGQGFVTASLVGEDGNTYKADPVRVKVGE